MRYLIVFFTFLLSVTFYGQNDYSMSFDGVDSEVILSDITMSQSFSFESYLFISSSTDFSQADAGRHIFSTGANNSTWASFAFGISDETLGVTQPTIVCELGSPSSNQFVATQSFPLDVWVHIGITFDNGQLEVYQNGVNILSNSTGISVSTNAFNSRIGNRGADWGNSQYQFEGNISHLSYWDITLSQTEIHQYMNCPPSGEEESLVGYWNFEEGSGTTAFDQTTNGNDGAINGATYSTDVPEQNCQSGCTDSLANNFNPEANQDDGTCCYLTIAQNDTTICEGGSIILNITGSVNNFSIFDGYTALPDPIINDLPEFTISALVRAPNYINTTSTIYQQIEGGETRLWIDNGTITFQCKASDGNCFTSSGWVYLTSPIPDDNWHLYTAIYNRNSGYMELYIDALLIATTTVNGGSLANCDLYSAQIGDSNIYIDELAIFNYAQNISQIQSYNCNSLTGNENGLLGYWNFNEGTGGVANDLGPYSFNGSLYATYSVLNSCNSIYNNTTTFSWSTGDTTATINVAPTQTTTYWVEQTENGVICTDSVTVNVLPTTSVITDITACNSYDWNGNTYTESGTYSYSGAGSNNYSMNFGTVNDYMEFTNKPIATTWNEGTISTWVKFNDDNWGTGGDWIFNGHTGTGDDMGLGIHTSAYFTNQYLRFGFYINQNWEFATSNIVPNIDQWYYLVGTWGANGIQLYIDGVLSATNSYSGPSPYADEFSLGRTSTTTTNQSIIGDIASFGMWNTTLTQQEIQQYMNCPPTGSESGLAGYWNFEEGQGTTAYDQTSNGNDGIINGATYDANVPLQSCGFTNSNGCDSTAVLNLTIISCGCTDSEACNFNENAVDDDGSCEYITPVNLGEDITTCEESVTLDAGEGYDSYIWSNGDTTQSIEVSQSGDYSVEVGNGNNSSLSFDGQNDYVQLGSSNLLPSNAITISTWFNSSGATLGTDDIFVSDLSWSTYTIRMGDQGNLGWRIQPNAGSPGDVTVIETFGNGVNYSDDNWHYISCTWDGSNMNMFIDGIQIPSNPIPTSFSSVGFTNDNATIGSYPTTNEEFFHGQLDNFEIWNTALSQSQIQNYMNCPPTGNEEGLVGYWNFDDGIGETAFDQTGNGNDGVVNGATWSTETPEQNCSSCSSSDEISVTINVCGCTDTEAVNYNIEANEDDSSCCYDIDYVNDTYDEGYADGVDSVICPENNCPSDLNLDGIVSTADLLIFLVSFGTICE